MRLCLGSLLYYYLFSRVHFISLRITSRGQVGTPLPAWSDPITTLVNILMIKLTSSAIRPGLDFVIILIQAPVSFLVARVNQL